MGGLLCPRRQSRQNAAGTAFGEHLRVAGAHSHLSPGPPFTKAGHFGRAVNSGGQNQDRFPSYSRPTGACCHPNLTALRLYHTPPPASLPVWCGSGRAENGACPNTDQLPQLFCTRRCHFNGISFKYQICRPQWAEASGITDFVLGPPRGFNQVPRRASLVNGGLGGR